MDVPIEWALNHGFAGSVDLHQATDWLPLNWFEKIETMLWQNQLSDLIGLDIFGNSYHPRLEQSRKLFYRTARSCWDNEGYCSRWWRGQPLGTLPSFEILTIEHFAIAETASFFVGLLDSPYALLGDDIVFFNRLAREYYINIMTRSGSPLSLHKSYENRITEFAGKIHIVNQRQAYTPDISDVAWYNLFDYQRSTGVVIRYRDLPKAIKQRLARFSQAYRTLLRPEDLYTAMQVCAGVDPVTQITDVIGELITNFYSAPDTEDPSPVLSNYSFQIAGYVGMYDHKVQLPIKRMKPHWWIKKFRPESTTAIVRKCLQTA
jgi:hypothetical protein